MMGFLEYLINIFLDLIFQLIPQNEPSKEILRNTKIVAHRGVHERAKENTLAAFDLAVELNLSAIEFDVRFTSDNIPVVLHDENTKRVFNSDFQIGTNPFQKLRVLQPEVPTLKEVISRYRGKLHFMIEIKEDYSNKPECVNTIVECLSGLVPEKDFHLLTLVPNKLRPFHNLVPLKAMMDVIWLKPTQIKNQNQELGHGNIAGHFLFFAGSEIASLHSQGKSIGVGYISSKNSLFRELNRGADWIFTNHPTRLSLVLTEHRTRHTNN